MIHAGERDLHRSVDMAGAAAVEMPAGRRAGRNGDGCVTAAIDRTLQTAGRCDREDLVLAGRAGKTAKAVEFGRADRARTGAVDPPAGVRSRAI